MNSPKNNLAARRLAVHERDEDPVDAFKSITWLGVVFNESFLLKLCMIVRENKTREDDAAATQLATNIVRDFALIAICDCVRGGGKGSMWG